MRPHLVPILLPRCSLLERAIQTLEPYVGRDLYIPQSDTFGQQTELSKTPDDVKKEGENAPWKDRTRLLQVHRSASSRECSWQRWFSLLG